MTRPDTAGWLPGYRGYVDHGVETPDYEPDEEDYDARDTSPGLVSYEEPLPETQPIAVKVVADPSPRTLLEWRVINAVVSASPQLIVGLNENRTSCKVRNNDGTNPVYVSPDSSPSPFLSWRIPPGGELSLTAITDVWAIADPGNTVSISILVEFRVER